MTTPDRTLPSELDALARDLESRAGTTPTAALRRDVGAPAAVRRIRDAATTVFEAIDAALASGVAAGDQRTLIWSIQDPENAKTFAGRGTKSLAVWANTGGRTFRASRVLAVSDVDDYSFLLLKSASLTDLGTTNDVLLTTVTCSTDGTAAFTADSGTVALDVEDGKWLIWEHNSGGAESVTIVVLGAYV